MEKKYFQSDYKSVSISDLILFSLYLALSKNRKCTFEALVKECFSSFPDIFSLNGISKWPDSRKLDRPLRTLKESKMVVKEDKNSFNLTKKGERRAKEVSERLRQMKLKI